MKPMIGVIGSGNPEKKDDPLAREVGSLLAARGAVLVCGGLSGIMEAACNGCFSSGGQTVGILPGERKDEANPYIVHAIPTGMGIGRNVLVVRASDAVIAFSGGYGTMSEIALALNMGKPVVDLGGWDTQGTLKARTAAQAVSMALEGSSGNGSDFPR